MSDHVVVAGNGMVGQRFTEALKDATHRWLAGEPGRRLDDSLGIAAELDAAIAAYEDKWAAVLADPVKLRRFVSFVNAPEVVSR